MLKGDLLPSPSFLIVSMLMLWNRGGNDCSVNPNEITEIIVGNVSTVIVSIITHLRVVILE